ncbi:MAG: ABC transporter ATP-binding protein [Elusimicrobia bacterium]|nr:ABC transporter ATP-binding protein [Elusimicrobiota bacterium]
MANKTMVETRGLRREFGDTVAVCDASFAVEEGAVFALVGPNGAGKTTMLRMMAGLLEPTSGTAVVSGVDIREHPRDVHALLGYLPDFFGLYEELRVVEYLEYFARAYRLNEYQSPVRLMDALAAVGLKDRVQSPIESLSRGMRQKLGIARTLLHDPPLLLLDEPAAGLDPESRHELQVLFRRLAQEGKTLIVSSHILSELEDYCTHVAILQRGVLAASGPVGEVRGSLGRGRAVRLKASGGWEAADRVLSADPRVRGLEKGKEDRTFDFAADDAALAALLKRLVDAGVPVTFFGEVGGGIEDAYLAILKDRRG